MIYNYLIIALRNFRKQKFYSLITVLGLAIGMTCCLLIFLYVRHERSYDRFHAHAPDIYRLVADVQLPTSLHRTSTTSYPMADYLRKDFPEMADAVRITFASLLMERENRKFQENRAVFADSGLFTTFSFPLIHGNASTVLREPFSVVLSEEAARKYFGEQNPLGQTLRMEGTYPLTVTGVFRTIPPNSHLSFSLVISMPTLTEKMDPEVNEDWGYFATYTYIRLRKGAAPKAFEAKLPLFLERNAAEGMRQENARFTLFLEPLSEVYLISDRGGSERSSLNLQSDRGRPERGSLTNVYVFSVIAAFILGIALINFINLTVARSVERAREAGIRKVVGASRGQLATQFLTEFMLLSLVAFLLAILLADALLPAFNTFSGKIISSGIMGEPAVWLLFLLLAPVLGLIAGIYPAWIMSGFQPVKVLKGRFSTSSQGLLLRKILVVCQFTISVTLIVSTLVVYWQLSYLRSQPLGFRKDQMLIAGFRGETNEPMPYETIKAELTRIPGVLAAAASSSRPGGNHAGANTRIQGPAGEMQTLNLGLYSVDFDFLDLYQIPVIAGRSFSREFPADSTQALMVNEATLRSLGYGSPEEIIGKRFSQWGREGQVIGVVKDFHYRSLRSAIQPLTLRIAPEDFTLFTIRVSTETLPLTLRELSGRWQQMVPRFPLDYHFLDEAFNRLYQADERFGQIILYFSGLAIFIACLGLLGLTSYTTVQRTKEIGIRKVLGASAASITVLLSKDLLRLVVIAFIIALPLAWYLMNEWLSNFAFRINLSWWIFGLAGLLALLIALLTVSYLSVKAALANPVDSLRNE